MLEIKPDTTAVQEIPMDDVIRDLHDYICENRLPVAPIGALEASVGDWIVAAGLDRRYELLEGVLRVLPNGTGSIAIAAIFRDRLFDVYERIVPLSTELALQYQTHCKKNDTSKD